MIMSKTTIVDIALALGITPSTVSRALAGNKKIKASTREAVRAKAKELGYERNEVASNLRRGVTKTVGIIVPRINREFFSSIISKAEAVLVEAGYSLLICQTYEKAENEIRALKTLSSSRVAGIMISHSAETPSSKAIKETIRGSKIKLVQFDRVFEDLPGSRVVNDDFNGAYMAVKHLIERGYKKIGAMVGYDTCLAFVNRYKGYEAALKEAGMPLDKARVFPGTIVRETGYANAGKAIDAACDALYSSGDFSALGALECALARGLRVPEDFAIVGTANESFTALTTPSMSSVNQNPSDMGRQAAEAMLRLLKGDTAGEEIIVDTELIVRESTGGKKQQIK